MSKETFVSVLSASEFSSAERVPVGLLHDSLKAVLLRLRPKAGESDAISRLEADVLRRIVVVQLLAGQPQEQATTLEHAVLLEIQQESLVADALDAQDTAERSLGERTADAVASFGGSWLFIWWFIGVLILWIVTNTIVLVDHPFDPFPFILLNLILSCIAALQAPVIIMSQNRQEQRDRERQKADYYVNLKAEIEIGMLQEKLDRLIDLQSRENRRGEFDR